MSSMPQDEKAARALLSQLFEQAIAATNPINCLPQYLPKPPRGRTLLIAAGKAAASMAQAAESAWPGDAPLSGVALTRYGHGMDCTRIEVIKAAHPVPDNRGYEAAKRMLKEVEGLTADDLLLFLVSGGGSALLALPADGISIDEKKAINKALLMSGAPIGEMNTVRKHLSAVKGGHLAMAAAPAKVVTLAISDVPFDDPSTIASGPTVPDPTTLADTKELIERYKIKITKPAQEHLDSPLSETPKEDDPVFQNCTFSMISTPSEMLDIVVQKCRADGHFVETLGANIEGEAKDVGQQHAELARSAKRENKTKLILSGGETTVTVDAQKPSGKGGRNVEYLLSLAIALKGEEGIYAIAADTDGIDGSEDNAGAIITPDTLARAKALNLDAEKMLEHHDAYSFFEALGDLVMTGPTRTNVNDFRAIFIAAKSSS